MSKIKLRKIIIARHYGFCMGVKRAISIAEKNMHIDSEVTLFNEIVHNDAIVERFKAEGVKQSKSIGAIDKGTVIISAHGVSPDIYKKASDKGLEIIDATCPLVIKIHRVIKKLAEDGYYILHFGDPDHDETIGIVGYAPNRVTVIRNEKSLDEISFETEQIALTSQSTASESDFENIVKIVTNKFSKVKVFNTICNATGQRQSAVKELAPKVDMMLVVGSKTSANSNRLVQISQIYCNNSHLINSADNIVLDWFDDASRDIETVGLTAGASAPDFIIEGAIQRLKEMSDAKVDVVYPPQKRSQNKLSYID